MNRFQVGDIVKVLSKDESIKILAKELNITIEEAEKKLKNYNSIEKFFNRLGKITSIDVEKDYYYCINNEYWFPESILLELKYPVKIRFNKDARNRN